MRRAREGAVDLLLPADVGPAVGPARRRAVFYNPAMALDRDLGVSFVRAWTERDPRAGHLGWEMLAATGVRGLRLFAETEAFASFCLTERNSDAYEVLRANALSLEGRGARVERADALEESSDRARAFDYVDVDPYGSPAPFVPAALDALADAGVLAVTATDLPVLAGVQRGACERRYGSAPLRGRLGPEGGLRILLAFVVRLARERGRRVRPLLAYAEGHHLRAYFEVLPARSEADSVGFAVEPIGTIRAEDWDGPELPGPGPYGPLWLGPLGDPRIVDRMRTPETAARSRDCARWIERLREERGADSPLFYEPNRLAKTLRLSHPPSPSALGERLRAHGFAAAGAHSPPSGFRTNAPRSVVERLARDVSHASSAQSQNARVRA
jgi:tRNA (guanine26-N2/guanine27-N2)-dimethyltransferase